MCGFAGFIERNPDSGDDLRRTLDTMVGSLVHRGPDDEGFWIDPRDGVHLGFRRLSIQDLSPMGHQPMASSSGRWMITFNGEVYNFKSLREELRGSGWSFKGGSDTEVLLAAVERWGVQGAVERLRGMFAFALWDRRDRELWLCRDRVGIKPLYVAEHPTGVVFGSELRALLLHPRVRRKGNPSAAWHFLRKLYVPAPLAMVDGVTKLLPGTLARFVLDGDRGLRRSDVAWWSLEEVAHRPRREYSDPRAAVDELQELLRESVDLRLIADVPVGALLSGGVDSSLVVALMAERSSTPVRTFTVRFDDPRFDEGPVAHAVSERLGTDHTDVQLPTSAVEDLVPGLPTFSDEPMANPSILPTLLVCQVARKDVTVALSGDGGDELFGGYNRYVQAPGLMRMLGWVPDRLSGAVAAGLRGAADAPGIDRVGQLLSPSRFGGQHAFSERLTRIAGAAHGGDPGSIYEELMSVGLHRPVLRHPPAGLEVEAPAAFRTAGGDSLLARMMWADQAAYLPDDLLAKVDRASMWTSLEVRVPLLDHPVVEWSWGLPDDLKIRQGVAKWCLRSLAERYLPAEILDRPKMGFTVPVEHWLRTGLADWLASAVSPERVERRGLLEPEPVAALHRAFLEKRPGRALALWALAVLEYWCETHGVTFD